MTMMLSARRALAFVGIMVLAGVVLPLVGCSRRKGADMNAIVRKRLETIATNYVTLTKQWDPRSYEVECTGSVDADGLWIVNVVHKDDGKAGETGGGKSVQLHVDANQGVVVYELAFQ